MQPKRDRLLASLVLILYYNATMPPSEWIPTYSNDFGEFPGFQ
ncbi:MAG TPA: hypothetical protein VLB46_17990 [Pyrinomonadaceae bacterium]|nr:hypothetical protein [Pyrinomonadaceae bacterium]